MNRREMRPAGPANPFEGFMLFVCALQGFLVISNLARPASIMLLLPQGFRIAWASLLMFGGLVALCGLYWPGNPFTGVEVKRVGLLACAFPSLAYGIALFALGEVAFVAGVQSFMLAVACLWRVVQVSGALKSARKRITDSEPHLELSIEPHLDPLRDYVQRQERG